MALTEVRIPLVGNDDIIVFGSVKKDENIIIFCKLIFHRFENTFFQSVQFKIYRSKSYLQADLVICGIFICEFAYMRL